MSASFPFSCGRCESYGGAPAWEASPLQLELGLGQCRRGGHRRHNREEELRAPLQALQAHAVSAVGTAL